MKDARNPFRLRASEHIEAEITFLRLFGPGILDALTGERLWDRVRIIRSAPGGGKTTLLRLFTPDVLRALHAHRAADECKELFQRVQGLGAMGDDGPALLATYVSCAQSYASLEDLELDPARRERLLFSLLSARVTLAALRGVLTLRGLAYPQDLHRVSVAAQPGDGTAGASWPQLPCDGVALHRWATSIEVQVSEALDALGKPSAERIPGHEGLIGLALLVPGRFSIDGALVCSRCTVMLDNVDKLAQRQRGRLLETILEARPATGVWIAERFDALPPSEMLAVEPKAMLAPGALQGRDYEELELETYWRDHAKKFEKMVMNVADRRANASSVDAGTFGSAVQSTLDGPEWQEQMQTALDTVSGRVRQLVTQRPSYQEWLRAREVVEGNARDRAIAWRRLEILIEREVRKSQSTFDFVRGAEELSEKDGSDVKAAADLFLAREFGFPYYFGAQRLATLASSNIEQFLWLAGDEFEEVVSLALLKRPTSLSPQRQDAIVHEAAERRWREIPRRVRNGRAVAAFLEAIGSFASWRTNEPNAPYAPGVTGIAISMADRARLCAVADPRHEDAQLAMVLGAAIAHNLLEPIPDYKVKGGRWMVLYLNRLLCAKFSLPLQYGGFKERRLGDLRDWLKVGFRAPSAASVFDD